MKILWKNGILGRFPDDQQVVVPSGAVLLSLSREPNWATRTEQYTETEWEEYTLSTPSVEDLSVMVETTEKRPVPIQRTREVQDKSQFAQSQGQWFLDETGLVWEINKWVMPFYRLQEQAISDINAECRRRILEVWPLEEQQSCSLGVYGPEYAQDCRDWIADNIESSNVATAQVEAANTFAEVEMVSASWPVYGGVKL